MSGPARSPLMLLFLVVCSCQLTATQAVLPFRPPAVPLVVHDPYFSIWSMADRLADDWTRHWTGKRQDLGALLRIDNRTFRVMGPEPGRVPAMTQTNLKLFPTRTVYTFSDAGVELELEFLSPLLTPDLDILARPVTYLAARARSLNGGNHTLVFYFDASGEIAVDRPDQTVVWSRFQLPNLEVLSFGSREQPVLEKSGDDLRIDWGYFYLAVPRDEKPDTVLSESGESRQGFIQNGRLRHADDMRLPRAAEDGNPVAAAEFDLGPVGPTPVSRFLMLAYDDQFSIEYFYRKLRPYWRRAGWEVSDLLEASARDYESLSQRCRKFDEQLTADLEKIGGEKYARLGTLAYTQSLAAHKLAADIDGTPLFFPKENFSNGCISTVDVIYPESPMYLIFNPILLRALLVPVLDYAKSPQWKFPFAPHDLGTYPKANGQVYGGGAKTAEDQMPVEESGNMLLMIAALAKVEDSIDLALKYWEEIDRWARYLKEKGLDPENQLCTDDFAGHLAHNANLSAKAILALRAYAFLCDKAGKKDEAESYSKTARDFAAEWIKKADDGDHFRLAFDKPGTWSQKYNLVWDKIFGFNLFPATVVRKEIAFYKKIQLAYGLPLDNRKEWTKLDWILWTAALSDSAGDFAALLNPVYDFLNLTPDRVPLTDWYWANNAKQVGFRARPVVGGVFAKMLADPSLRQKWLPKK